MKTLAFVVLLGWFTCLGAQAQFRGNSFGRISLTSEASPELFPPMFGTIQQTINDFRSGTRGTVRSSMMVASSEGFAVSSWDVLRVRKGRKLTMQTTFLSVCGCGAPGVITLTGRARVKARAISYSATSANGTYSLNGVIRWKRNRITRTETRSIYDVEFEETNVFHFSSSLSSQSRGGK